MVLIQHHTHEADLHPPDLVHLGVCSLAEPDRPPDKTATEDLHVGLHHVVDEGQAV